MHKISKFGKSFQVKQWKGEALEKVVSLDTETRLIEHPGDIPDLVITTAHDGSDTVYWVKNEDVKAFLESLSKNTLVFHSAQFDVPVLEKSGFNFHEYLMKNQVFDTAILYRLISIGTTGMEPKKWALDHLIKEFTGEELEKDDTIRLTFGQYLNPDKSVNYARMSEPHLKYACLDVVATRLIYEILMKKMSVLPTTTNCSHLIQLLGDIALAQVTRNGIGVDMEYTNKIRDEFKGHMERTQEILATYGLVRGQKGFNKVYEGMVKFLGLDLPLTEDGRVSSSVHDLEKYKHIPFVSAYCEFKSFEKQQNFLNLLTSDRVHPRYNTIKNTLRTSCTSPNIQQMPRIGGIRECFTAKPGFVFLDLDYSAIELCAIASLNLNLFGHSVMARLINEGKDLHIYAASKIYKIPEDQVTKHQRQLAKALNFGLVANMSGETFVGQAANYGVTVTPEESEVLKAQWAEVFPEMKKYWKRGFGKSTIITRTGFVVANCRYTQYLNYQMQSLVAEGAKLMLYSLYRSPFKVVAFVHDQVLIEIEEEKASVYLPEVTQIMVEAMEKVILGVKVRVDGEIKKKFTK
jgi:DNA polymerase-1